MKILHSLNVRFSESENDHINNCHRSVSSHLSAYNSCQDFHHRFFMSTILDMCIWNDLTDVIFYDFEMGKNWLWAAAASVHK